MLRLRPIVLALLLFPFIMACQRPGVVPAGEAPMANLSDPACPNLNGTYEMFGEPLPGMPSSQW